MYRDANAGHVGSSLSCAEILTFVRLAWMKKTDEWILSKGHAAAALYATLAEAGEIEPELLDTFYKNGTLLSAHPPPNRLPGIRFATGSLGHGLSLAAGMALGRKLARQPGRIFCITSDGELNEGSTWEAALFAAHHQLTNLIWLVDRNGIQGFGRTEETLAIHPLKEKLASFGFEVEEADGHQFPSLIGVQNRYESSGSKKPLVIICHTIKGKGMGEHEDTIGCHYLALSDKQYEEVLEQIQDDSINGN